MAASRRHVLMWLLIGATIPAALVIVDLLLADAIFSLEEYCVTSPDGRGKLHYWFQILTGNWSEQRAYTDPSFMFSLIISTAILLNFGPAVAIFGLIAGIYRRVLILQRENNMKLAQALAAKDEATKQALYSLLSDDQETINRINEGFKIGEQTWRPHLVSIIGRKAAGVVFALLGKDIPQHR